MNCCVQFFDKTCTVVFYCMSLSRGQATDIYDLDWPRYKSKHLVAVMFGATSINAIRLTNHLPKYHLKYQPKYFPHYIRNSVRRLETILDIYGPGIGVWNVACIPREDFQNCMRSFGVQDQNLQTDITRNMFFVSIKSQKIRV